MPRRLAAPCRQPGCPDLDCQEHRSKSPDRRASASTRGYGRRWQRLRLMYLRHNPICEARGCERPATDVDHKKPKRDGGTDEVENLQALCHSHHSQKTARGM